MEETLGPSRLCQDLRGELRVGEGRKESEREREGARREASLRYLPST